MARFLPDTENLEIDVNFIDKRVGKSINRHEQFPFSGGNGILSVVEFEQIRADSNVSL